MYRILGNEIKRVDANSYEPTEFVPPVDAIYPPFVTRIPGDLDRTNSTP